MFYLNAVHKTELNFRQPLEIKSSSSLLNILVSSYLKNNLLWVHPENRSVTNVFSSHFPVKQENPTGFPLMQAEKKNPKTVESMSLMRPPLEHKSCAVIGAWKPARFNIFVKFI